MGDLTNLSGADLTAALSIDFDATDDETLAAALTDRRTAASALLALDKPTLAQVSDAKALVAAVSAVKAEADKRTAEAEAAGVEFAALRDSFASETGEPEESETGEDESSEDDADAESEALEENETGEDESSEGDAEGEGDGGETTVTAAARAAATRAARVPVKQSAAKRVASANKRPARASQSPVTIVAAANVPDFSSGAKMTGMADVTKAHLGMVNSFPPHDPRAAEMVAQTSGGKPVLSKFPVAKFGIDFDPEMVSGEKNGYEAVKAAQKKHAEYLAASMRGDDKETLTAAGFCAPSENVYTWIADYVVDGLLDLPEVSAPRGGLNITKGPQVTSQGTDLDNFGWTFTEAEMEAGVTKVCETIECPPFEDHRLDAIGYCWKFPFLTMKAYPEIAEDALRLSDVRWAHRLNRRYINDLLNGSQAVTFSGYGPSFTDALETLSIIAVKERRRWNLGENAVLEVKLPVWVKEVFRADMSRRSAVAFDSVKDAQIAAHFADRNLAVTYLADWAELGGPNAVLPGSFPYMIYPSGTWVKALEDIVNLSAVYDAASLSANEYTGVFFEQATMTVNVGYRSLKGTVPVNTAGEMGGLTLSGLGDAVANGSY